MAIMPGAQWRPMPGSSKTRMASYDLLLYHTCVGSLAGTDAYFRSTASGTNSHFGVGGDGTIYQWVDTAYRSGASLNGNYHAISVETADMGPEFPSWTGSNVPSWTAAQLEACARIAAWVNKTHGTPLIQIPDSKPTRRGVGYHRLGVPGYMVAGGEQWSTAKGKVCPGDRRISQVPAVISRALQLTAPPASAAAQRPPVPSDTFFEEFFAMASDAQINAHLDYERRQAEALERLAFTFEKGEAGKRFDGNMYEATRWISEATAKVADAQKPAA
jgi:hypothetical protein